MRIGAVIMAAGLGERFGGDKLFAGIGGKTMIENTLQQIPKETFETVVVVAKDERILLLGQKYGYTSVRNENPEEGISGSIRLGTERVQNLDAAMYLVCDQPYLTEEVIRNLAEAAKEEPERIIVPEAEGRWGNPCVFPKKFFEALLELTGDTGGKAVIRKNQDSVRTVTVPAKSLMDIDRKEDLAVLSAGEI